MISIIPMIRYCVFSFMFVPLHVRPHSFLLWTARYQSIGRVAVGTALAGRPPRRSGRAAFPHPAPRSGHRGTAGAVCRSSSQHTFVRPCVRRMGDVEQQCPCATAFPPSPPRWLCPVCSGTSLVLCGDPTAWIRTSSAIGTSFPTRSALDCSCRMAPWQTKPSPPDSRLRCVCACSGLRPRRVLPPLAIAGWLLLPSVRWDHVGTRELQPYFGAQYWAYTSPVNASRTALLSFAHDSGPEWLARLLCWGLAPLPSYRF
jgi:hypothetical protein